MAEHPGKRGIAVGLCGGADAAVATAAMAGGPPETDAVDLDVVDVTSGPPEPGAVDLDVAPIFFGAPKNHP